jgi:hypothetical protein
MLETLKQCIICNVDVISMDMDIDNVMCPHHHHPARICTFIKCDQEINNTLLKINKYFFNNFINKYFVRAKRKEPSELASLS